MTFWVRYIEHTITTLQKWSALEFAHVNFPGKIHLATNEGFFGAGNPLAINPNDFFLTPTGEDYPLLEFAVVALEIGDLYQYSNGYPIYLHLGVNGCMITHWYDTGLLPKNHTFPGEFKKFCTNHHLDHLQIDGSGNRATMTLQEADRMLRVLLFGSDWDWDQHPGMLLEAIAT